MTAEMKELFLCDRFQCKLLPSACLQRQQRATEFDVRRSCTEVGLSLAVCAACEQGKNIEKTYKKKEETPMEKQVDYQTPEQTETPDPAMPLCHECQERPSLPGKNGKPKNGLCGVCNGKRIKAAFARKKAQKTTESILVKTEGKPPEMEEKTECLEKIVLQIDFTDYPGVMAELRKSAVEDIRPIEMQAVYILRDALEHV